MDVKAGIVIHAQGTLNLVWYVIDYPRRRPLYDPNLFAIAVLLVIYAKLYSQSFGFCWIVIYFFFYKSVEIVVVNFNYESVLW